MLTNREHRLFSLKPWHLAPDDGTGAGGSDDDGDDGDGDTGDGGDSGRTYTQADLDRILTGRIGKASKTAKRELFEALGVKDEGEAKRLLAAARKADEANRSESDRAKQEATERANEAAAAKREAAAARMELKIDRKLLAAGADKKRLGRLSKMVFVELDDDADDDDIAAAIDTVKDEFSAYFGEDDDQQDTEPKQKRRTGPAPSGNAQGGKGPGQRKTSDALSRGRDRARRYQGRDSETKTA